MVPRRRHADQPGRHRHHHPGVCRRGRGRLRPSERARGRRHRVLRAQGAHDSPAQRQNGPDRTGRVLQDLLCGRQLRAHGVPGLRVRLAKHRIWHHLLQGRVAGHRRCGAQVRHAAVRGRSATRLRADHHRLRHDARGSGDHRRRVLHRRYQGGCPVRRGRGVYQAQHAEALLDPHQAARCLAGQGLCAGRAV